MKGMKNVEVAGPGVPAPLKRMTGGAKSGNVNTSTGAPKVPSLKSTSQPNTKTPNVKSPAKSR